MSESLDRRAVSRRNRHTTVRHEGLAVGHGVWPIEQNARLGCPPFGGRARVATRSEFVGLPCIP